MPSRNQSGKPEHAFQNPNKKRKKSGKKYEKLFAHCKLLKKKEAQTGMTKWLEDAWMKVGRKMKKYGVSEAMVEERLKV